MQIITFNNTELHLKEHLQHEFLLSNREVALGYGVTRQVIDNHKRDHSDELIEGKHWLRLEVQTKGGKQKVIHWTKKGIVRLGFFIKSQNAKKFRDWAEDYIVNKKQDNTAMLTQLKRENIELKRAINRLTKTTEDNQEAKLKREIRDLKNTLVKLHDSYHQILTTCSPIFIQDELIKMTNLFQLVGNIENDGQNLNTETVARHRYWNIKKGETNDSTDRYYA